MSEGGDEASLELLSFRSNAYDRVRLSLRKGGAPDIASKTVEDNCVEDLTE